MVAVNEYKNHDMYSWIPEHYWDKLHIIPDDSDVLGFKKIKPLVVLDHGIFDITHSCDMPEKRDCYSLFYADYYLSSTKQGHEGLLKKDKKSFYVGSPFSDFVFSNENKKRNLLVYVPDHGCFGKYYDEVVDTETLLKIAEMEDCEGVVTSALMEDSRVYYNPVYSNRHYDVSGHHSKCKSLLETGKVFYAQVPSTLTIVAKNMGLKVIGHEYELETIIDGNCRERILEVMDGIISGRY